MTLQIRSHTDYLIQTYAHLVIEVDKKKSSLADGF